MRSLWLKAAIGAAAMIFLVSAAQAGECYYKGQRYSDGARNDQGQVCDGQTGTWK